MRLCDGAADGQAQAHAGRGAFAGAALEFFKQQLFAAFGQAGAFVGDGQGHRIALGLRPDVDGRAGGRVLGGVFQQIDQHALHQHGVDLQQWQVVGQVHVHTVGAHGGGAGSQRTAHHFFQRLPGLVELHGSGLQAGHVQQVVDQRAHALGGLLDRAGQLLLMGRQGRLHHGQRFGQTY